MSSVQVHPILVSGQWRPADCESTFQASDPSTSFPIEDQFPRSRWSDCEAVLDAATTASRRLIDTPAGSIARFLEAYADGLQFNADAICEAAQRETGLALQPRLLDIEMPRT
ncbi:MAG TPA: ketoglutarate semialdehyde dehydrogenase, partial [Planctomycetaceae bacterium]|nr:ketoglutarate semialdehyde dehydrogenase [Planctomycetaceae bacterium]